MIHLFGVIGPDGQVGHFQLILASKQFNDAEPDPRVGLVATSLKDIAIPFKDRQV